MRAKSLKITSENLAKEKTTNEETNDNKSEDSGRVDTGYSYKHLSLELLAERLYCQTTFVRIERCRRESGMLVIGLRRHK